MWAIKGFINGVLAGIAGILIFRVLFSAPAMTIIFILVVLATSGAVIQAVAPNSVTRDFTAFESRDQIIAHELPYERELRLENEKGLAETNAWYQQHQEDLKKYGPATPEN